MFALSAMWAGFLEPGMMEAPICTCQRRITWAEVLPYFSARATKTGSSRRPLSPWPSGYHASITVPYGAR